MCKDYNTGNIISCWRQWLCRSKYVINVHLSSLNKYCFLRVIFCNKYALYCCFNQLSIYWCVFIKIVSIKALQEMLSYDSKYLCKSMGISKTLLILAPECK